MIRPANPLRRILSITLAAIFGLGHAAAWIGVSDEHHTAAGLLASQAALLLIDLAAWAAIWVAAPA